MPFHIFTWKTLGVINGPGLARPREESGTKLTWPSIAGWEACRELCGCTAMPLPLQPHSVFVGRRRGKAGTLWSKGCSGTREVTCGIMGQKWRLLKLEAMQRLEGSAWVPGAMMTTQRLGWREKAISVLVTSSSHSGMCWPSHQPSSPTLNPFPPPSRCVAA